VGLSLRYRHVIKAKTHNCCAEDLPQVRQVQVPEGFRVSLRGVVYGLEWVTVRLPVMYRGGVAQGGEAGAQGPPPARVGNAELWTQELEVRGLQVRGLREV